MYFLDSCQIGSCNNGEDIMSEVIVLALFAALIGMVIYFAIVIAKKKIK